MRWCITSFSLVLLPIVFISSIPARVQTNLIFVQVPVQVSENESVEALRLYPGGRYIYGARIVRLTATESEPVVLTPEFAAACDPDISFDGKTIVFSGKRNEGDAWHIWRMNVDGSRKVQVTSGEGQNITPVFAGSRFYLNDPAPTPQIIFASSSHGWRSERNGRPVFSLYGTDDRGEVVRRLTFNLSSDYEPDVLPGGRIVFTSRQAFGDRYEPKGIDALMGINIDGTDLMAFYGNHEMPVHKNMARASDHGDRVYFVESGNNGVLGGGDIAYVSRRRPLHSYNRITGEDSGVFHSPCPTADNGLIASYRPAAQGSVFGLYRIEPSAGERLERIFDQSGWHSIDAHELVQSPTPKGRSNWLVPGTTTGVFYCLNSYRTNLFDGDEPAPGQVKFVRVIEGVPALFKPADRDGSGTGQAEAGKTFGARRLLGIAPVEDDGSFHIRIPAEIPITFQLLDENYIARRTQKAWTWVMGNENRGCIGCHEDRELSPPNVMVDAVVKPAVELTLPPARRRTVDYRNQISSIVADKCAVTGCHADGQATPDLAGSRQVDGSDTSVYENLLVPIHGRDNEKYVIPGNAKESPLIWLLFGRRLGSVQTPFTGRISQMPPHNGLTNRERILFIEWVDLGAHWDARSVVEQLSQ